jgi:hypothetical protein
MCHAQTYLDVVPQLFRQFPEASIGPASRGVFEMVNSWSVKMIMNVTGLV